jgi:hypothetical protein
MNVKRSVLLFFAFVALLQILTATEPLFLPARIDGLAHDPSCFQGYPHLPAAFFGSADGRAAGDPPERSSGGRGMPGPKA